MKIELATTKKKLTKSIVNQFRMAPPCVVAMGKPLGFVVNVVKDVYEAEIIECGGDYFFIPVNLDNYSFIESGKKYMGVEFRDDRQKIIEYRKFETEEELESFWTFYQNILNNAGCQIYVE